MYGILLCFHYGDLFSGNVNIIAMAVYNILGDIKMIKKRGFVKHQKYKVYMFLDDWMNRKIAENRELTLVEAMALLVAYSVSYLTSPYEKRLRELI